MRTADTPEVRARAILTVSKERIAEWLSLPIPEEADRQQKRRELIERIDALRRVADRRPLVEWEPREDIVRDCVRLLRIDPAAVDAEAVRISADLDMGMTAAESFTRSLRGKGRRGSLTVAPIGYPRCTTTGDDVHAWSVAHHGSPRDAGPRANKKAGGD